MNTSILKRGKIPTKTQTIEALEDYQILKAQRAFHVSLIQNFEKSLAEFDAKINAIQTERLTLIEKHEQAPGKIVECDRRIAALENAYGLTPNQGSKQAPKQGLGLWV